MGTKSKPGRESDPVEDCYGTVMLPRTLPLQLARSCFFLREQVPSACSVALLKALLHWTQNGYDLESAL